MYFISDFAPFSKSMTILTGPHHLPVSLYPEELAQHKKWAKLSILSILLPIHFNIHALCTLKNTLIGHFMSHFTSFCPLLLVFVGIIDIIFVDFAHFHSRKSFFFIFLATFGQNQLFPLHFCPRLLILADIIHIALNNFSKKHFNLPQQKTCLYHMV